MFHAGLHKRQTRTGVFLRSSLRHPFYVGDVNDSSVANGEREGDRACLVG